MTYLIIKHPHPLDAIWSAATEAFSDAESAMSDLGDDFEDDQLEAVSEVMTAAIQVIQALPARNFGDILAKLNCDYERFDVNVDRIIDEGCDLISAGMAPRADRNAWVLAREAYLTSAQKVSTAGSSDQDNARRATAHQQMLNRFVGTPAPDHAALKMKLDVLAGEYFTVDNPLSESDIDFVIADVCCLGGLAVRS